MGQEFFRTMDRRVFTARALASLVGFQLGQPALRAFAQSIAASGGSGPQSASRHRASKFGAHKKRLIVLTDIGSDPDDTESTCRLLLYSNEIDIEGLIASTSIWRPAPRPELLRDVIRAYAKVHGNLLLHDRDYPSAEALLSLVKDGRAEYGMKGVGPAKDSEGSDWIIRALRKNDDRPLWISIWGGANTLAQALYRLRATETVAGLDRLAAKLRVYAISDQDDSGPWIRKNFPKLFYIVSPGGDYSAATWQGINLTVPGIDNTSIGNEWLAKNIQEGHGALGAAYPDVAYGMEGDTPSWLGLIPNGLNDLEHPNWGSWGGRYELYQPNVPVTDPKTFIGGVPIPQETRPIWTNAIDHYTPPKFSEYGRAILPGDTSFTGYKVTVWRWRDDFQNDFAARMNWTTKPYKDANHPPVITLNQPDRVTVRSGSRFGLSANATDPDGDSLTYYWFQYPEAGTYKNSVDFGAPDVAGIDMTAPKVEKPETIHFILRVSDKGDPPLARYKRIIVTVTP